MNQTNLSIGTIGQRLESARQTKGVSVSEAGQATKILGKFIEAMEADDFGALSAPVYAKSFIKMYAKYLGIDGAPLVEEYVAQHSGVSTPKLSEEVRQKIATVEKEVSEGNGSAISESKGATKIFSGVNEAVSGLSNMRVNPRTLMIAGAAVLVLIIFLVGVQQCAGNDEEEGAPAAAGSAVRAERQVLSEGLPDVYLVKPGVIEVDQN